MSKLNLILICLVCLGSLQCLLCDQNQPDNSRKEFDSSVKIESNNNDSLDSVSSNQAGYVRFNKIEGRVIVPAELPLTQSWIEDTRILVNHGEYLGFLKSDGSFEINNLSPGSYLIDITNPNYLFEPMRVEITSKGKIRARKVNYIQTSAIQQLPYPLRFKPKTAFKYFQTRENWKLTDVLFNPMVLMMVFPLLLLVLPKMVDMEDSNNSKESAPAIPQMPQYEMPELSEMMTYLYKGGSSTESNKENKPSKASKKRN